MINSQIPIEQFVVLSRRATTTQPDAMQSMEIAASFSRSLFSLSLPGLLDKQMRQVDVLSAKQSSEGKQRAS